MAEGRTLWQMLMDTFSGEPEGKIYNPLKAKIGAAATIDEIEWKDHNFFLREIREYRRLLQNRQYPFVDYTLIARPLNEETVSVRIRLLPVDDPERVEGLTHHALLLQLFDEMEYNEGLHQTVNDDTLKFQVLQDGVVTEEYWRINDVGGSYKVELTTLADDNQDKRITRDEVDRSRLEYWDYWRDTVDAAGVKFRQYLFVEMNASNGWFQIWRGTDVDPQHVVMF